MTQRTDITRWIINWIGQYRTSIAIVTRHAKSTRRIQSIRLTIGTSVAFNRLRGTSWAVSARATIAAHVKEWALAVFSVVALDCGLCGPGAQSAVPAGVAGSGRFGEAFR